MTKKNPNKHRELIQYLKHTAIWLEEHDPEGPDNEVILLDLIRKIQQNNPLELAIMRERLYRIAKTTEREANPSWSNPLMHWKMFKSWAEHTLKYLDL